MRIVSLLPSATEVICSLGLEEQLVGVTHECDWPASVCGIPRVTRTFIPQNASSGEIDRLVRQRVKERTALYSLDVDALEKLNPDLIITQTLCDVCAVATEEVDAAACMLPGNPTVVHLEPQTLDEVIACVQTVADAAGVSERGREMVATLRNRVGAVAARSASIKTPTPMVLIEWIDPLFGCGHWSPEIIELAGGKELIGVAGERSRTFSWDELVSAQPEVMLIACCGMNIDRAMQDLPLLVEQKGFHELPCVRNGKVWVMDGSAYFSRPGPRLVDSLEIVAGILHPDLHVPARQ